MKKSNNSYSFQHTQYCKEVTTVPHDFSPSYDFFQNNMGTNQDMKQYMLGWIKRVDNLKMYKQILILIVKKCLKKSKVQFELNNIPVLSIIKTKYWNLWLKDETIFFLFL